MNIAKIICVVCVLLMAINTFSADESKLDLKGLEKCLQSSSKKKSLSDRDYILVYYSAHRCPPCRAFTPKLVEFYNANSKKGNFEVIFFSDDCSEDDMQKYMKEMKMPWLAIAFDKRQDSGLDSYCGQRIPCLVLFDKNGKILSDTFKDGKYLGPTKVLEDFEKILKQKQKK